MSKVGKNRNEIKFAKKSLLKLEDGFLEFVYPRINSVEEGCYIIDADEAGNLITEFRETIGPSGVINTKITKRSGGLAE